MDYSVIPVPVLTVLDTLKNKGFRAHVVGGCVRDLLLGREPKDWDITTDAKPDQVLESFPDSFYENDFGTVGVKVEPFHKEGRPDREHDVIEVTTYRAESSYSDRRRPDQVSFVSNLTEDLSRRDFTMNAIALEVTEPASPSGASREIDIIDPFHGQEDIRQKMIRTVGNPEQRFGEDALRMMRAVRLYAELREPGTDTADNWVIDYPTVQAIRKHAQLLCHVSRERIRDEFSRIIVSGNPSEGVELLRTTGLLHDIIPELEDGVGIGQNLHHKYEIYEHNLLALRYCPSTKLDVRLASLLHDVGKPRTKRGEGYRSTFYNHDHVGARMTKDILRRLRYPVSIIERVTLLVDNHLFYYNVGEVTEASVRRLIKRVGLENMRDLMAVRIADRLGSGVPKAKPYKLRHLEYMIDKVSNDPVSVKMLAIGGSDLMNDLGIEPGPKLGAVLDVLLSEVIGDPSLNLRDSLLARAKSLSKEDIDTLRERAREVIEEKKEEDDRDIRSRHRVAK
ncbi:MAG: CCA tRNA nucleotidyltransferase [Candidatus Moranbacteria bacterium]|nr:CCA tRNA nucleotidyltransferase [Candidatus Moranbacteria bacterium]